MSRKTGGLILFCAAVAGCQAWAQTPMVTGVANEPRSSATLSAGSIGYVFGSNFGTAGNTTVTVRGLNARVLTASSDEIVALFPPNLPEGLAKLAVTVDGRTSETVDVNVTARVPGRIAARRGSVSGGPASPSSPTHRLTAPSAEAPAASRAVSGTSAISPVGIVYTCDPNITAKSSTACATLNTTIAALYSSSFTNANASIYIQLGSTALGLSDWETEYYNYSNFRSALIGSESDANDVTAVTDSVPATSPFGSDQVEIPTALARALGLSPTFGITSTGMSCTLGPASCYDGLITISNTAPLYFRTGTITGSQFDFFTVAEHETDEILGTASCAVYGDCGGVVLPADFYRYHSNGTRATLNAGTNDPCSSSDSTNACFSFDGVHMLQQYNNVATGDDAGDWTGGCGSQLVQDAVLCAGTAGVDISPAAEILVLDVIGYKAIPKALQFYSLAPCRVADTRSTQHFTGSFGPPSLAGGTSRSFPLLSSSTCTIPSTAQAYSLNFTAVPSGELDYLSVWPTGDPYPGVSTLNSPNGAIIANAAIVPAGTSGAITVLAGNPSDVIIDINGYFAPAGASGQDFFPLTPCRVADTRSTQHFTGAFGPPSLNGNTRDFPLATSPCLSGSEQAYSLNFTVVPPGEMDFLSVWPVGQPYPGVSTLNAPGGNVLANAAIVPAGTGGDINVLASDTTDLIIDVNGKFATAGTGGLQFYAVTPCRVADTRSTQNFTGAFGPPSLATSVSRNFPIPSSSCGIPGTAQAYAFNMTVVPQGALGFLSVWPQGQPYPGVSTLNSSNGEVIANAAIVPAGTSGGITALASNPTDLIIDIVGYFAP